MSQIVPVITVDHPQKPGESMTINKSEFDADPEKYTPFVEKAKRGQKARSHEGETLVDEAEKHDPITWQERETPQEVPDELPANTLRALRRDESPEATGLQPETVAVISAPDDEDDKSKRSGKVDVTESAKPKTTKK